MGNLQFNMSDKQETYVKSLIIMAQGSFLTTGVSYNLGSTIVRIVEEWCENHGIIKKTKETVEGLEADIIVAEEVEITTFLEASEIIKDLDPGYDFNGKKGEKVIEYAKKLRG